MEQLLSTTTMMLYKNMKETVRSSDEDAYFFDIVAGVLQEKFTNSWCIFYQEYVSIMIQCREWFEICFQCLNYWLCWVNPRIFMWKLLILLISYIFIDASGWVIRVVSFGLTGGFGSCNIRPPSSKWPCWHWSYSNFPSLQLNYAFTQDKWPGHLWWCNG